MNLDDKRTGRFLGFLDRMLVPPEDKITRQGRGSSRPCCGDGTVPTLSPGVLWEGIFQGWYGYAKANRELMFRVANHLHVQIVHALRPGISNDPIDMRLSGHERIRVAHSCPVVRFCGPDIKRMPEGRKRINFTMMETEVIHPDMVESINRFDELWTPTSWNMDAFLRSGVTIPIRTVPLGVDGVIYRPIPGANLPACTLLSRGGGTKEIPKGFLFLSVSLPSYRKGFDLLASAFEEAFADRDDVALVIATTHFSANTEILTSCSPLKSRIYALEGSFTEHEMARIYSACDIYVSCSRGEGWNLPMCEAAACGLPVIVPRNTTHEEVTGGPNYAFFFDTEGVGPCPAIDHVSQWYVGMPFSVFGDKSRGQLVDLLRHVEKDRKDARYKAANFRNRVLSKLTWDEGASVMAHRLMEGQP